MGLQNYKSIISCTLDIPNVIRGYQIQARFNVNSNIKQYAIVDDNSDMATRTKRKLYSYDNK